VQGIVVIFVLALAGRQAMARRSAADPAGNDDAATAPTEDAAMTCTTFTIIGLPKSGSVIIPVDKLTMGDAVGRDQE